MSQAQPIIDTIISDAREDAKKTLDAAIQKASKLNQNAEDAAKARLAEAMDKAAKEAVMRNERAMRMAQLDEHKADLGAKRALIEEAFAGAEQQLLAMSAEQKRALAKKQILLVAEGGEALCPAASEENVYTQAFLDEINKALTADGKAPVVLGQKNARISGGVILMGQGVEYDLSYAAQLRGIRSQTEAEVAAILFDE